MQILFLCVANSARSQMAEGLARAMAPKGVIAHSAGSNPSHVRPEAIAVLQERQIDIQSHWSKSVNDINLDDIDLVITLCEDEVCPVVLSDVRRLHWPFPDPATAEDVPYKIRLQSFREARDAISDELTKFFERQGYLE